jgi:hypothetical protein
MRGDALDVDAGVLADLHRRQRGFVWVLRLQLVQQLHHGLAPLDVKGAAQQPGGEARRETGAEAADRGRNVGMRRDGTGEKVGGEVGS